MTTTFRFARPKDKKLALVVTGTGRSGTGFASRWLMSIGIPSGHELFFSHGGLPAAQKVLRRRYHDVIADCSWLAGPYLDSVPLQDALIVHQVRHPKKVIESCMRAPIGRMPHYAFFLERHLPVMRGYLGELNKTACRWIHWNAMIENVARERESLFWRVEDGTDDLLQWLDGHGMVDAGKLHPAQLYGNTRHNAHRGEPVEARLEDVHPMLRSTLEDMMTRYGYDRWE